MNQPLSLKQLIAIEAAARNTTDSPAKIAGWLGAPVSKVTEICTAVRGRAK